MRLMIGPKVKIYPRISLSFHLIITYYSVVIWIPWTPRQLIFTDWGLLFYGGGGEGKQGLLVIPTCGMRTLQNLYLLWGVACLAVENTREWRPAAEAVLWRPLFNTLTSADVFVQDLLPHTAWLCATISATGKVPKFCSVQCLCVLKYMCLH